jgi:MFS family permease
MELLFALQESLFFATEALTVFQWSRASDRIGRKPVLLVGLLGTFLSMQFFGLSRTFWTLVIRYSYRPLHVITNVKLIIHGNFSRCLCGLLNGNIGYNFSLAGVYFTLIFFLIGVMKSSMGELTDTTNRAETFALMPVVWALGASMG